LQENFALRFQRAEGSEEHDNQDGGLNRVGEERDERGTQQVKFRRRKKKGGV
jgi:hypothetical protein